MNATDTDIADLEGRLRAALRARADATPVPALSDDVVDREFQRLVRRRPAPRRNVLLAGCAAAAALFAVVVVVSYNDGTTRAVHTLEEPPIDAITLPVPRLLLGDLPMTLDSEGTNPKPAPWAGRVQAFRLPGRLDGPYLSLTTLPPSEHESLGVGGTDLEVRHGPARLTRDVGAARIGVELDDGRYLWVVAAGVGDEEAVAFVDGLQPTEDGRWEPTTLPEGLVEIPAIEPADGSNYSAWSRTEQTSVEVSMYSDGFESRLADRVASSVTPIEVVAVAGRPAALGSYSERDVWVLLEPEPGVALELRLTGYSRAEITALLASARFVDEATWDAHVVDGN